MRTRVRIPQAHSKGVSHTQQQTAACNPSTLWEGGSGEGRLPEPGKYSRAEGKDCTQGGPLPPIPMAHIPPITPDPHHTPREKNY